MFVQTAVASCCIVIKLLQEISLLLIGDREQRGTFLKFSKDLPLLPITAIGNVLFLIGENVTAMHFLGGYSMMDNYHPDSLTLIACRRGAFYKENVNIVNRF